VAKAFEVFVVGIGPLLPSATDLLPKLSASLTLNKLELQQHGSLQNREVIVGDQR
jgi:hypothetical protein